MRWRRRKGRMGGRYTKLILVDCLTNFESQNSTRHTLSSHRAFVKIDRRPEEKGKGCFWSFNSEYEIQFSDQWQAALANSRNPAPPRAAPPPRPQQHPAPLITPNRMPGVYPPPHPPWLPPHHYSSPPVANGVTPPHLMPHPHPPYPPLHMRPPYPHFPLPGMPPPPGFPHPPPPGAAAATNKNKAQKKTKALGSAFSRAPLIRPGIAPPSGKEKGSPFSSAPLVRKATGGKDEDKDGGSEMEEEDEEREQATIQAPALAQPPMGGMYPPRAYAYGPPRPPPPHPNRPPPHARLSILLAQLPSDAPPCGPEPVTFYGGKMYLRPEAHTHLTEEDMKQLNELCVGEAFGYLLARCAGIHRPPFPPFPPTVTGVKEKMPSVIIKTDEIEATVGEAKS